MPNTRFDVVLKVPDTRAIVKAREFNSLISKKIITHVHIADSYTGEGLFSKSEIEKICKVLTNKNLEICTVNGKPFAREFSYAIEIGYLPGVTDNVGNTAKESIEDALSKKLGSRLVSSSKVYALYGEINEDDVKKISKSLYNPLIERVQIYSWADYESIGGFARTVPKVLLNSTEKTINVSLDVGDDELAEIGNSGIKNHDGTRRGPLALSLLDMQTIRNYFKNTLRRNPTDIELESLAQTWSEHCKHRIFASPMTGVPDGLYKTYIKQATVDIRKKKGKRDFCVSVFSDNSGIIKFDDNWFVSHKVETHNSPSALDPFGGAITGIVGVNRDAIGTGIGAKPVANIYGFCVGNPDDKRTLFRDKNKKDEMLSPRRILDGVVSGVNAGGNCSGIPTVHGFLQAEDRFRGKPLVFAGTIGLLPKKSGGRNSFEKGARPGDYVVMVGNRVGLDGIHGATFSSVALDEGSPATAVQIGDPITQKKMSDAIVKEARDLGLYNSITDNGAGGLSSAVFEMAREAGGCHIDLEKVPVKYPGLAPWQIWISESQERMTISVPKNKWKKLKELFDSRGVEATVIGEFTKSKSAVVSFSNKKILDIPLTFLHDGWPRVEIEIEKPVRDLTKLNTKADLNLKRDILTILSRPSIANNAFIGRQYDHEVGGGSVLKPIVGKGEVPSPSAVFKPVLDSKSGVLLTSALYPTYSDADTYLMAQASIDTALRQALVSGAPLDHIAILDNFCWSRSNTKESMYELKEAVRACYETAVIYETPFISGKDSMHNDFRGFDDKGKPISISIPPTLLVSAISVLKDALTATSLDFKNKGDFIYLVGDTHSELGCSEYASLKGGATFGVPKTNPNDFIKVYKKYEKARTYVNSAYALGRGGVSVAISKMAIGGMLGFDIDIKKISGTWETEVDAMFSESQGRIVCSVSVNDKKKFEEKMGIFAKCIGRVTEGEVYIRNGKNVLVETSVEDLNKAFRKTYEKY